MIGELYKTNLGWAVKFPSEGKSKKVEYSTIVLPIKNKEVLSEVTQGQIVEFSVKFKKSKKSKGTSPYALINLGT